MLVIIFAELSEIEVLIRKIHVCKLIQEQTTKKQSAIYEDFFC